MAEEQRPTPVVTIVDPACPAPVHDVLDPPVRRLSNLERGLVAAVVLLLLAGASSVQHLQHERRLERVATHLQLAAALSRLAPPARFSRPVFGYVATVTGDPRTDVQLRDLRVDGGWHVTSRSLTLVQDATTEVTLSHDIDCSAVVPPPTTLTLRTTVPGDRTRDTKVVIDPGDPELLGTDQAPYCGEVEPGAALLIVAADLSRLGVRVTVTVELANLSVHDLVVTDVTFPGFTFRPSRPLPLPLPARAAGVLRFDELVSHPLMLEATVSSCGLARAALDTAEQSGQPDLVTFFVRNAGNDVVEESPRDVRGIESYLEARWASSCG